MNGNKQIMGRIYFMDIFIIYSLFRFKWALVTHHTHARILIAFNARVLIFFTIYSSLRHCFARNQILFFFKYSIKYFLFILRCLNSRQTFVQPKTAEFLEYVPSDQIHTKNREEMRICLFACSSLMKEKSAKQRSF